MTVEYDDWQQILFNLPPIIDEFGLFLAKVFWTPAIIDEYLL